MALAGDSPGVVGAARLAAEPGVDAACEAGLGLAGDLLGVVCALTVNGPGLG